MKSFALIAALASLAVASPVLDVLQQQPLLSTQPEYPTFVERPTSHPGFDLDLSERRLVQLEGQDPVWISELDKVQSFQITPFRTSSHFPSDQSQGQRGQFLRHVRSNHVR